MCISNAIKVEPLDRPHFVSLWGIFVRRRRRADRNLSSLHAAPADMKELQRERLIMAEITDLNFKGGQRSDKQEDTSEAVRQRNTSARVGWAPFAATASE